MRAVEVPEILILSTHTSGLYRPELALEDGAQPFVIEMAAALCSKAGTMLSFFSHIIKPEGRKFKEGAVEVHGITPLMAAQIGIPENRVIGCFLDMLKTAPMESAMTVVTYGTLAVDALNCQISHYAVSSNKAPDAFDKLWRKRPLIETINLMVPYAQQACRIPGEDDYKWPSLEEAAGLFLGTALLSPRDAWTDLLVKKEIYFAMQKRGYFQ